MVNIKILLLPQLIVEGLYCKYLDSLHFVEYNNKQIILDSGKCGVSMQHMYISLTTAKQVQQFVKTLTPLDGDFELISGKFVLDARSLMGVFSLDLTRPIKLKVYNASPENLEAIRPFLSSDEDVED